MGRFSASSEQTSITRSSKTNQSYGVSLGIRSDKGFEQSQGIMRGQRHQGVSGVSIFFSIRKLVWERSLLFLSSGVES
jgi:hypothetical protein